MLSRLIPVVMGKKVEQFLKLFNSANQIGIIGSVILILIGLITPKSFLSIEVDWTILKSAAAVLIGLGALAFFVLRSYGWFTSGEMVGNTAQSTFSTPKQIPAA